MGLETERVKQVISEHDRISGILEAIRLATLEEIAIQQAQGIYHAQWHQELDRIARSMDYSSNQQILFRVSNDCQRLASENASAVSKRRELGRRITRALKIAIARNGNAAKRSGSAA